MAKARKGKQTKWVPANRFEVTAAIEEIGAAQRKRAVLEAEMNQKLSSIQLEYAELVRPLNERESVLTEGVAAWCQANRAELTEDNKVKFHDFPSGRVNWYLTPWSVTVRGVEEVIKFLRKKRLSKYLRTKVEVDKTALLRDRELLENRALEGITFKQEEVFSITPISEDIDTRAD